MNENISTFDEPNGLISELGDRIAKLIQINKHKNQRFSWLISGGRTPELLFKYLNEKWLTKLDWKLVDVFWIDERCVSPKSKDSNYGQAYRILFQYCDGISLYPIFNGGELLDDASSYQKLVCEYININGAFDFALLGIGEDGHFASLFHKRDFLNTNHVFVNQIDRHPYKRITMNITVIFNSKSISVIALGREKGLALRQSRGILGALPISCKFWVDEDFMKEFKNTGLNNLNEY